LFRSQVNDYRSRRHQFDHLRGNQNRGVLAEDLGRANDGMSF
jgi:hypothetical protein